MIIAVGLATFLPSRAGAVPWGASVIAISTAPAALLASSVDSAPPMEPDSYMTRSDRVSPSALGVGRTRASPLVRNPASGADDHSAVDLLAEDGVRAADISGAFGCHGGGLDPKAELAKDLGGIEHALVARAAPLGEREVEVPGLDLDAQHARLEQPERLEEQFFAGLIPVEHSNRVGGHRPNDMARSTADRAGGQLGGEQRADVELFARAPSVNGAAESSATIDSA